MVERAAELRAPFMAGSFVFHFQLNISSNCILDNEFNPQHMAVIHSCRSLVTTYRAPFIEHPLEVHLVEAVAVGFSGLDIYAAHTLEVLQCMVERRKGGESGVAAVRYIEGAPVWAAGKAGLFSMDLAQAACDACNRDSGRTDAFLQGKTMQECCRYPG
eukprot:SAG31_NODE_7036_length_1808_cov_1.629023_2_plen_159_part_00